MAIKQIAPQPDVGTHLQNQFLAAEYEGKQKIQKGQKRQISGFFALFVFFAFFASTLPFTVNPDFENMS
jgi:hypothetical protein